MVAPTGGKRREQPVREGHAVASRMFRSERQANFRKSVQKEVLVHGKKQKDEETRRMEEYRKLCKREGIVSQRILEYDALRNTASEQLDVKLREVEHDPSLSNAEKRRRKFTLKRKLATTPITQLAAKKQVSGPVQQLEKIAAKREAERQEREAQRQASDWERQEKFQKRREVQQYHRMTTKKGQPVMSGKLAALMTKIVPPGSSPVAAGGQRR